MEWNMLFGQPLFALLLPALIAVGIFYQRSYKFGRQSLDIGEESAIGSKESQEDAAGASQTTWGTLTVLAQGMGKGQAGKIAALITVRTFMDLFVSHDVISNIHYFFNQAFSQSNREVLERLQGAKGGTAVAAVAIHKGQLYYASVGDVKIAVFRKQELISINDGHTMKSAAIKGFSQGVLSKEQALAISKQDRQSNYLGRDGFKNIEMGIEPIYLTEGDIIIVMNQGIYKCLSWVELESILTQTSSSQRLAEQIIGAFNAKNVPEKDNANLFVLRYNGV